MATDAKTTVNADGFAVHRIPLTRPRVVDGVRYDRLDMVEPHVKARMRIDDDAKASPKELEIALVAILCGVPERLVEMLSLADYQRVQQTLANFPYPEDATSGEASCASPA